MAVVRGGTVRPHVQRAADELVAKFGSSLSPSTYPGHSPPEGPTQALDLFTPDNAAGWAQQDRICAWLIENAKRIGLRYCIRREEIWNIERAAEGWRRQTHYGDRTADHYDHVHATFYATAAAADPEPEPTPEPQEEEMALQPYVYDWNGSTWLTDGMFTRQTNDPFLYLNAGAKHLGTFTDGQHNELVDLATLARKGED